MIPKDFLQVHSRSICLALAVVVAGILSLHPAFYPVTPIADGAGYALRAFVLYGYLHTGQWANFWTLFTSPNQSILPLHYLPFFMLPGALAGTTGYATVHNFTTYLLLAYAVFKTCQVLHREEWAPAIFLLCSVNNIALTDFYAFYLDMQFFALGLLVIALQMQAWSGRRTSDSILAGVGLGLLFWMKPANALIFLVTFTLSEIGHAGQVLHSRSPEPSRRQRLQNLLRHWGRQSLGFLPLLGAALVCGGAQTILLLIDNNELHNIATPLDFGGLLRLFYFPLCFSSCYHVLLLGGLLLAAALTGRWLPGAASRESIQPFPWTLFLPVAFSYLVLGEFFSFWMLVKPMRSLLLALPLLWLLLCWWWEKRRLRSDLFLAAAVIYAAAAFSQKAFNLLGAGSPWAEDNYQLSWSSWTEMPAAWHRGPSLNKLICDFVIRTLPPEGIICVNSIEIRNSLAWRLESGPLLLGQTPPYKVRYLFNYKGDYYDQALVGSNAVVLITFFPVQSSRTTWVESTGVVGYANDQWCGKSALAHVIEMPAIEDQPIGYEFIFDHPLTQAQVDQANQAPPLSQAARVAGNDADPTLYGRHYSRAEAWSLLKAWFEKRFDSP